jgi:hypothetical protein
VNKELLSVCGGLAIFCAAMPAQAGRTAVDANPGGDPIYFFLDGYCDFNGDDCGPDDGVVLPYSVSFGGGAPSDRIWVHGNGILSFGGAADFFGEAIAVPIIAREAPALTAYGLNLVSGGQAISYTREGAFVQSARLTVRANGSIVATWFTCTSPTSETNCPADLGSDYSLLLRPTAKGFRGSFGGQSPGTDIGYVSDGVFTPIGKDFLMPATFSANTSFVPEPSSWALLIAGFGMTGVALRRRRTATA